MVVRVLVRLALGALLLLTLALVEPLEQGPAAGGRVPPVSRSLVVRVLRAQPLSQPLAGVELVFLRHDAEQYAEVFQGTSDAKGELRVQAELGVGWLIARKSGFARAAVPLAIEPGTAEQHVTVELVPSRTLSVEVRVETESGELVGLSGASVLVGAWGELPWGAQTPGSGLVTFEDVPARPLRVQVFAPGYEPYVAETEADLLVRLRAVMALRVFVTDQGQPREGAEVHVSGLSLWPARVVSTGADGFVDIHGLGSGSYSLYAEHGARVSAGSTVELLAERGLRTLTLTLFQGEFLDIEVSSDLKTPIAGAQLTWSTDGLDQLARRGETDAAGHVSLGPVASREGWVQASAPGFVERVVPMAKEGPLEIVLDRAGIVTGRVVDERGFPVQGAEVEVVGTDVHGMPVYVRQALHSVQSAHFVWALEAERRLIPAGELGVLLGPVPPIPLTPRLGASSAGPPAGSPPAGSGASQVSGSRGHFRITGVPPGQIVVLARHPDFIDGKSKPVALVAGGQAETEVVLRAGQPLRGRVVDDRDFPVPDARVDISARGFSRQVAVGVDGTFALRAAPLDLSLRVSRLDRPLRVLLERRLPTRVPADEVQLVLPAPRQESVIVVVDERGERLGLAQVRLSSKDPRAPLEETRFTSERGEVEFADVRGLAVSLDIKAPGFVDQQKSLELAAENRIQMVRALVVVGRITTARGRLPASFADVVLQSGTVQRRVRANEAGEYRLIGVAPGRAQLRAQHAEHGRGERQLLVAPGVAGRDAELPDLDLTPTVELKGRVVDDRGFPVPLAWISTEPLSVYLHAAREPLEAVRADENGEFTLHVAGGRETQLFAVAAARAGGSLIVPRSDRDRVLDLEVRLDEPDPARPDELGTVLLSLSARRGPLVVTAVARSLYGVPSELARGDIVLEIDGHKPANLEDARALLSGVPGSDARLLVERAGRTLQVRAAREAFQR